MCGIAGFNWSDELLLSKMNHVIRHRGPDDSGCYVDDRVSLGSVRLSVIDLTPSGHQPMENENGSCVIVYNGEVYNFRELREQLETKGRHFRSSSDTEVVLQSYEEWGPSCVERFDGMWAFAIFDRQKEVLFLSRDRFGIKPLYFYLDGSRLIFASEIKSILQHDVNRIPNDRIIMDFLVFGRTDHSRETFFQGIRRLMPGENLVYDIKNEVARFYKWYYLANHVGSARCPADDSPVDYIRRLFRESIESRMVSDVPVGSCLSGGIDSSAIVCSLKKCLGLGNMNTFSLVFPGLEIDESQYVDEVILSTGYKSNRITPDVGTLLAELPDLVWTQEEPFESLSVYGQYKVMQLAHDNNIKVLLDGQGGDEIFAGYRDHFASFLIELLGRGKWFEFAKALRCSKESKFVLLSRLVSTVAFGFDATRRFATSIVVKRKRHLRGQSYPTDSFSRKFGLSSALVYDIDYATLPKYLRYEDKNSMRWSTESRVPFLSHSLVEASVSLPSHHLISDCTTKSIFRKALVGVVPQGILDRKDKVGFATPDSTWFVQDDFRNYLNRIVESPEFRSRKYWNPEIVRKMVNADPSAIKESCYDIWRMICTELWLRCFIDPSRESLGEPSKPQDILSSRLANLSAIAR